jgi:hypothetical protein
VEAAPSLSADLGELRNEFRAELEPASGMPRGKISILHQACIASISRGFGSFLRSSSTISSNDSPAFWGFTAIFENLKGHKFTLLRRGNRDTFKETPFNRRWDGHPNVWIVILEANGNIFSGFTPVERESTGFRPIRPTRV